VTSRLPDTAGGGAGDGPTRVERIVERVRAIPEGFVRTYGDIDPSAPRLVGHVLATTDLALPWHRVVRADGTAPVGRRQLDLLRGEGVPIRAGRVDLAVARLPGWVAAGERGSL
jgi:methylated-DNA-protein-cysteine methyltransferase related protein